MTPEIVTALASIARVGSEALLAGFFVFLRVGAAMALLPAFGEQAIPQRVRLGLTLAFTAIVAPAVAPQVAPLAATGTVVGLPFATEVLAGLALGIGMRIFVLVLQMAGTIAAQSISLSQFFGGAGVEPQPAISQLLVMAGLALAVMAGLHVRLAQALIMSYDLLPAGAFPDPAGIAEWGIGTVSQAVSLAFMMAAPFVIASLIYNVALGVINRAMPQLMVAFVGAPALTLGGLLLLLLVVPLGLQLWMTAFDVFLADPFTVVP